MPAWSEDLPLEPLLVALRVHARRLAETPDELMHFGERTRAARRFGGAPRRGRGERRRGALRRAARALRCLRARRGPPGDLVFDPLIAGSRTATARFTQPLYRRRRSCGAISRTSPATISTAEGAGGAWPRVLLGGPWDALVLQTEGSGVVELDDGDAAGARARRDRQTTALAPGRSLSDRVPATRRRGPMMTRCTRWSGRMRAMPEAEMRKILERNTRYGFFKPRAGRAR